MGFSFPVDWLENVARRQKKVVVNPGARFSAMTASFCKGVSQKVERDSVRRRTAIPSATPPPPPPVTRLVGEELRNPPKEQQGEQRRYTPRMKAVRKREKNFAPSPRASRRLPRLAAPKSSGRTVFQALMDSILTGGAFVISTSPLGNARQSSHALGLGLGLGHLMLVEAQLLRQAHDRQVLVLVPQSRWHAG